MTKFQLQFLDVEKDLIKFGTLLREKRNALRLSMQGLSDLTHGIVSKQYIGALELAQPHDLTNKVVQPSVEKVDALAKVLDWDLIEARILAGHSPPKNVEHIPEAIRAINFSLLTDLEIEQIVTLAKVMINQKLAELSKQEIRAQLGFNVKDMPPQTNDAKLVADATFPKLEDTKKIRHIPEEIATENAVGNKKKLLTGEEKVSNITEPYNDINPSPERKKIVMKKARYAAKQEPDVADEGEEAA